MKSLGIFVVGMIVGATLIYVVGPHSNSKKPEVAVVETTKAEACPVCEKSFSREILAAPVFKNEMSDPLVTNRDGEVRVAWLEVPGAKNYQVYLENSKGKTVRSYKTSRTVLYLKEIPIPEGMREVKYQVRLTALNGLDGESERGVARLLVAKAMGSLTAPKVREIRVED